MPAFIAVMYILIVLISWTTFFPITSGWNGICLDIIMIKPKMA